MVVHRRLKILIFLPLTSIIFVYYIYLIIAACVERKEICEKLNYKHKKCDSLTVNPKREILQDLLREWIKLTARNNISYVLSSGSLLGQFRNGDIILWDNDVDVILFDNLYSKLVDITTPRNFIQGTDNDFHFVVQPEYNSPTQMKRWNCNGQVVTGQPDHCSFIGPIARLIKGFAFLDIFGLKIEGNYAYESYEKKYFRLDDIFPEQDCFFMNIKTKCPHNKKKVLETFFHSLQQPCVCIDGKWIVESWWKF